MGPDNLRLQILAAMGIDVWVRRHAAAGGTRCALTEEPEESAASSARSPELPADQEVADLDWEALRAAVAGCTACELHKTRTNTVFGVGDTHAQWMIVGEAPGADEDLQGEPFVGRAGQLLNQMLSALGLKRAEVFIANILKCRPPNNRDPRPEEVVSCQPYLNRQIELVQPRIVLAVGRVAAQHLLRTPSSLARLRGVVHDLPGGDVPVVVTYHPAYLLRSPQDKRKAWADLCLARQVLEQRDAAGQTG